RSPVLFFFQAEDGIRDFHVTGVQTCALPIYWLALDQLPAFCDTGVTSKAGSWSSASQCEVARRPVSRPAAASSSEPVHTDVVQEIGRASCREGVEMRDGAEAARTTTGAEDRQ